MSLRRNYDYPAPVFASLPSEAPKQEYEVLLEFDLKRQKQKNMILEERLKNKQLFIQQMRQFQEELTAAYEQCKNELIVAQEKVDYLQNVEYRQYTEQIADLKHMLMLKNQENQSLTQSNFKNNTGLNATIESRKKSKSKSGSRFSTKRESMQPQISYENKENHAKTFDFIAHFLRMSQHYLNGLAQQPKLSKKLKRGWRWIKQVVKERQDLSVKHQQLQNFRQALCESLETDSSVTLTELFDVFKQRLQKQQ